MDKKSVYVKKSRIKKKKFSILPTITLFLVVIGFGYSSYIAYEYAVSRNERFEAGYTVEIDEEDAVEFRIPYNSSTEDIAELLLREDLIGSVTIFKVISNIFGYDGRYTSGTHILNKKMKYEDIMLVLTSPPEIIRVTFPEGFTTNQIRDRLVANGLADGEIFDELVDSFDLKDFEKIIPYRTRDHRLDGYLFPDTYEFDKNAGEEFIIQRLLKRFEEVFDDDMQKRADDMDITIDDIVIIASMLEKEATTYDERRKVAGVIYNRLNSEDESLNRLQIDATIQYIIVKKGGEVKPILSTQDTLINDRYNTYVLSGLPPGPICNPGLQSLMAALYPESHDFYYYVLDPDGSGKHIFSKTYEEHLEAMGN
jgi:UPF0755 protein